MKTLDSLSLRSGAVLAVFERLDADIRSWALANASEEHRYPVLIPADTLRRAEYPEAFPHLLMAPAVAQEPAKDFSDSNVQLSDSFLSPAVCYHTYAALEGEVIAEGRIITARGCCFRNEKAEELVSGRRQIEFEMREVVLVGAADWIESCIRNLQPGVERLARQFGITGQWLPAHDPFFLPRARGKAQMQRLLGTKIEYCLPDGLAIASINRHGCFFGERFQLRDHRGSTAHSACIAFGLDRWAAQLSSPI